MSDRPDFRAIKAQVTMRHVLRKYGIELRMLNGSSGRGKCPLPMHDSEAKESTFNVNTDKNVWACHSSSCVAGRNTKARDGASLKKGGDVLEFVKHMERLLSLRDAGVLLESWFGLAVDSGMERPEAPGIPSVELARTYPSGDVNKPLTFVLKDPNPKDPYLHMRGFEEEECEYLGVGFFRGKGMMEERIVFPIHNEKGELLAYAGRSTDREVVHQERWRFPPGFHRGQVLYNRHRVESDWVIVVESFWGVLACVRAGIFNAVALMGSTATDAQVIQLVDGFSRITVLLDGDEAGRSGTKNLLERLSNAGAENFEAKMLRDGVQPDHVKPDSLRVFLGIPAEPDGEISIVEESFLAS